jgi:PAS domain S-box-containing protein
VIGYDSDLTVTAWNRAAEVLYGMTADDVLGRPLPDAIRRDEVDVVPIWDPFVDAMRGWRGRSVHRDADGYDVSIETKCVPLVDADGKDRGWVMVDREVADG